MMTILAVENFDQSSTFRSPATCIEVKTHSKMVPARGAPGHHFRDLNREESYFLNKHRLCQ